jgi:hypothetical protein
MFTYDLQKAHIFHKFLQRNTFYAIALSSLMKSGPKARSQTPDKAFCHRTKIKKTKKTEVRKNWFSFMLS